MNREEFIEELVRRFSADITNKFPYFKEICQTENPNTFIGKKDGAYFFIHIRPLFDPLITFSEAKVEKIEQQE